MNQQPSHQDSILQVFLNDKPEVPHDRIHFDLSAQEPIFSFQEHVFGYSNIKCQYVYSNHITARFSSCYMEQGKTIYSIPAEPVVTFHIQVSNECSARFDGSKRQVEYSPHQSRLFWQNHQTLVYDPAPEDSIYFNLFIRPSYFKEMACRYPVLAEMAIATATTSYSELDVFVDTVDSDTLDFIGDILREVRRYQVSHQRFTHLCECLLLQSMKIPVVVEPLPIDAIERTPRSAFLDLEGYVFTEKQKWSLESLQCYSRDQLIAHFKEVKQEYLDNKRREVEYKALMEDVRTCYYKVMGDAVDQLADAYYWMARQLDEQAKKFTLTEDEKFILKEGIITVCYQSFELRRPNEEQLEFYTRYTGQPYVDDLSMREFGGLLNRFIPDMELPLDKLDDSREAGAIVAEYLQDRLGFKPLSHFVEKGEKDKPQKVVELYHTLIQKLVDEFTISDVGEIKKSDLIRVLDHAYEQNDLLLLLLVEVEQLTDEDSYIECQSFEKISLWVMAIEETIDDYYGLTFSGRDKKLEKLLEIYFESEKKWEAVERQVRKTKAIYEDLVATLLNVGHAVESTGKVMFLLTVESLIAASENPFE